MSKSPPTEREHEKRLVQRARQGDRCATRELVGLHKDRLFAFIRRMVRNHHDAEEICQDAFLKAFASLDSYSSQYRFSTWLFTISYRVCLNWLRRRRPFTGELDFATLRLTNSDASSDLLESEEVARVKEAVWSAVDCLSAPQKATVLLFYRQSQSCHEIAHVLNLPVATVKSHLHRARARLRDLLEPTAEKQDWSRLCNLAG